ncbi:MAG: DUF5110 domain-containing protein [Bacteroidales bacterium]|nr:DUF5110 domain-containing protein [Candidatus Cryptobacteroides equifaecalis]
MKKLSIVIAALFCCMGAWAQEEFHPVAKPEATVISGNARFTVLTPRLVRMEWAENAKFEDHATLGIINRDLPVPEFKVKRSGSKLTISTGALTIVYKGNEKFSESNLSANFTLNGKKQTWQPGADAGANLGGTVRTLDGFDGKKFSDKEYDNGVISRDGWAIIDESSRHIFTETSSDWKYWVAERDGSEQIDWYLFAYGHDYTEAISDFTKIAGKVPLPPRYAFGYWWCRYWAYSDTELVDLAQHFRNFNIPIDVMIIDMDWHETYSHYKRRAKGEPHEKDESGYNMGWTGYTWNRKLFPSPENCLEDLHSFGVKTALNLHPASGLQTFEEPYERFREDYLSRTNAYDGPKDYKKADGSDAYIPFRIDQEAWADAYFNSVLNPMENYGVDFWWLDWQQKKTSNYVKDLSNTYWLNYTFFNDMARRSAKLGDKGERPMIYHRWGGIGSHRYQLGFSGDTHTTWKVLQAIPDFTATASNVCYGYWGHDIGGHYRPGYMKSIHPELYLRWLQSGVFTPIFKTHSTRASELEKRFWVFPDKFDAMRDAIKLRYALSPYIYNAARQAYDTGICMCRPLYYYLPETDKAYSEKEEFFFGDDILATVVCQPVDSLAGLSPRHMWFPQGSDWFDMVSGKLFQGGSEAELSYTLSENPWYARSGAVIPMAGDSIRNLQEENNEFVFQVIPGEGSFSTRLYEDDGKSSAYDSNYATTDIEKNYDGKLLTLCIKGRKGSFKGCKDSRKFSVVVNGACAPSRVSVNGTEIPYRRSLKADAPRWKYDGKNLNIVIELGEFPATEDVVLECETSFDFVNGERGLLTRLESLTAESKLVYMDEAHRDVGPVMSYCNGCASAITESPFKAKELIDSIDLDALREEMQVNFVPERFIFKTANLTGFKIK